MNTNIIRCEQLCASRPHRKSFRIRFAFLFALTGLLWSAGCNQSPKGSQDPSAAEQKVVHQRAQDGIDDGSGVEEATISPDTSLSSQDLNKQVKPDSPKMAAPSVAEGANELPGDSESAGDSNPKAEQTWTRTSFVALAPGGPRICTLLVNAGGKSLQESLEGAIERIAKDLDLNFDQSPPSWDQLLNIPAIKTGWMGNLVAEESQRRELIGLYDQPANGIVERNEFRAFLSRGLTRTPLVRIGKDKMSARGVDSDSPWGPIDTNGDGVLDKQEIQAINEVLQKFDFDGDSNITRAELDSVLATPPANSSMVNRSMLDPIYIRELVFPMTLKQVRDIMEHYSFSDQIVRQDFWAWDDERWNELDADHSGTLEASELMKMEFLEPHEKVVCRFPGNGHPPESSVQTPTMTAAAIGTESHPGETNLEANTSLVREGIVIKLLRLDDHAMEKRLAFLKLFQQAQESDTLRESLTTRLQVAPDAFEFWKHRATDNSKEMAGSVELPWRWLVASRDSHISVTWRLQSGAWFDALDGNGNGVLTLEEIRRAPAQLELLDRDDSETLSEAERPISITVVVHRKDDRLAFVGSPITDSGGRQGGDGTPLDSRIPDWFGAMDTNQDGSLSPLEFLGQRSHFDQLDRDKDGIIESGEVYSTP